MQSSGKKRIGLSGIAATIVGVVILASMAGCFGRGFSLPSIGHSTHRTSNSHDSRAASSTSDMYVRSVVILANALEIWRQIDADNAAEHSLWVFKFQSSCPRQTDAQRLIQKVSKSFTSSATNVEEPKGWLVKATSSVQQVEMSQSRLSKWVESASSLSEASGCRLTAWEIEDVDEKKAYRSETSST